MKRVIGYWLLIVLVAGLMVGGCYQAPAPPPTPTPSEETPAPSEPTLAVTEEEEVPPEEKAVEEIIEEQEEPAPTEETAIPGGGTVHQVTIQNFAFSPEVITIKIGDTVTWTEQDSVHHTATGDIFNSEDLGQGQTYSKTFDTAGTYDYGCNYHPIMRGKVIVE